MIRVAIFGSCVTGDAFDYVVAPLDEVFYSSRTSFASVVAPPLPISDDALVWSGYFARKRVLADFGKTTLAELVATAPDAVIFDFIDDRHDLLRSGESIVLDSEPLRDSGFPGTLTYPFERVARQSPECARLWKESAVRVAGEFSRLLPAAHLLLHRAWWALEYTDGADVVPFGESQQAESETMNAMLADYYAHWQEVCPGIIPLEVDLPIRASKRHKWGLAPFHYETAYYQRLIALILEAVT